MALTALDTKSWVRGWTWSLPDDATCARRARMLITATLTPLVVCTETVRDIALMASELATNALQHAPGYQPYELWLALADDREAICAIFDTLRVPALTGAPDLADCDFGRGLAIVAELSDGRWGMYPTWSRQHPEMAGKAVWFACPVTLTVAMIRP
jgi:hypothetical protein